MSFSLKFNSPQIADALQKRAAQLVAKTAAGIEARAKISMAEPKTGRKYKVSKTGKAHQASAPGQAPAIDTAMLVNSIGFQMVGELSAVVGVGAEYAVHLEFGTAHIAPRPFLGPAFEATKPEFEKGLRELL